MGVVGSFSIDSDETRGTFCFNFYWGLLWTHTCTEKSNRKLQHAPLVLEWDKV